MPGPTHEGLRLLLSNRPELVRELLAVLGVALPDGQIVEVSSAYSDLSPATYSADLVVAIETPRARAGVVVEVQNGIDPEKPYAWPRYAATEHARRRCATWVLVIATNERVAAWARRPIETFQPGTAWAPLVLGPSQIPRITRREDALAAPELAVLSAVMHRDDDDGTVALAAMEAALTLDIARRGPYTDLVYGSANEIARAAVEAIMRDRGYEPLTQIGREMLAKGHAEGRQEGREEGTAAGELRGLRAAVATACRAVGVSWTDDRTAIVATMNLVELEELLAALVRDRAWPSH